MYLIGTIAEGGSGAGSFELKTIHLHTGFAETLDSHGSLEEFFVHECTHASLAELHVNVSS